jgi:2-polyprenyl-3-methyl-5-hydroxy-6-metoxy-1,4-benzoquinol methylase
VIRNLVKRQIDPYTRVVAALPPNATVVDVGCGNHSPKRHRELRPDLRYYGVDVQRYNLDAEDDRAAARILILSRENFSVELGAALGREMADLVTLKHVIEHLDRPIETLLAAAALVKPAGRMFLSFPSEESVGFPGGLNFRADATHVWLPRRDEISRALRSAGLALETFEPNWRHPLLSAVGALEYGYQKARQRIFDTEIGASPFLWSLFGFETVVVARR